MARLTETPAPAIEAVYACVKLLNEVMLLQGAGARRQGRVRPANLACTSH